jgi:hypothetical protein
MAKAKRNSRFDVISKLYEGLKSGNQTLEQIKMNLDFLGYFVTEAEIPKFAEQHPEIDVESFTQFLKDADALKVPKGKTKSGGGQRTHLNTVEAAQERGVAPENVQKYLDAVNAVYASVKTLNECMTTARASFACPQTKVKTEEPVSEG